MNLRPKVAVFVDTSIQIGRRIHRPEIQDSIRSRLAEFPEVVTGLVVRNEFKRRLLEEAQYLLSQFVRRGSYEKVRRHVMDSLGRQERKRQICLQTITTIDEQDDDVDRTDRARLFLRDLLRFGLKSFDAQISKLEFESGCACGLASIKEKKKFGAYDFGPKKCSKTLGGCGIATFLKRHQVLLRRIADDIESRPAEDGTGELEATARFIRDYLADPTEVEKKNPCTVVGDLLIALESFTTPTFYTMNYKESRHLCRLLGQRLIYRHPNPDHDEVDCPAGGEWPKEPV